MTGESWAIWSVIIVFLLISIGIVIWFAVNSTIKNKEEQKEAVKYGK